MKFNLLFKLKKLLAEMGSRVCFFGKDVLEVSAEDLVLNTRWLDPEWPFGKSCTKVAKFIAIRDEVQTRMDKGKGKGPSAPSR